MRINEKHNICGERLRKIRKRRGLSQEDLAAKLQLRGLDLTQKPSAASKPAAVWSQITN